MYTILMSLIGLGHLGLGIGYMYYGEYINAGMCLLFTCLAAVFVYEKLKVTKKTKYSGKCKKRNKKVQS